MLWGLFLSQTSLTGKMGPFNQFPGLIELNLSGNDLTGTIPNDFLEAVPDNRANLKAILGEDKFRCLHSSIWKALNFIVFVYRRKLIGRHYPC